MSVMVANHAYSELLAKLPPRVIRTEEQNESYIEALHGLEQNHDDLSEEERELADVLTLLIEDFEEKHYQLPKATPLEMVSFLMDQHGLKQKDMLDVFATPSVASDVLSGKRDLNKDHIAKLSARFHVSPELFF